MPPAVLLIGVESGKTMGFNFLDTSLEVENSFIPSPFLISDSPINSFSIGIALTSITC